jgi:hypothetical protein
MCICIGKASGTPLKRYYSESEAHEGVLYVKYNHGKEMTQYLCDKCGLWHLSPISRATPSHTCEYCTGRNGKAKESYRTKLDAQLRAEHIENERKCRLHVYQCPHGDGWHLTKKGGLNY